VVAANGNVTFQNAGTWYDYLTGSTISATGGAQAISLQPGEYHVYLNRNVTSITTPVFDIGNTEKTRMHIYPNPVHKNAILEYEVPVNGAISLSLLDMYGRRIEQLYAGFKVKGSYQLPLAAGHLTKGVYFVQLDYGKNRTLQKILVN
jgi:hypothetical protein